MNVNSEIVSIQNKVKAFALIAADAVGGEEPIRHETEFQGSHRAFEGQPGDVHHHPALLEIRPVIPGGNFSRRLVFPSFLNTSRWRGCRQL
jgi:hypothetical protein